MNAGNYDRDSEADRAEAMALRLRRTAGRFAFKLDDIDSILRCFRYVSAKRLRAWPEPHPDFLHAARTALILLDDLHVESVPALCAGLLYDSDRPDLSASESETRAMGWEAAADLIAQFPRHGLDNLELLESLLSLDPLGLAVVLAERLDHARHLHFRPAELWRPFYQQLLEVYMPVAARSAVLSARFDAWAEAFSRRLMRRYDW